MSEHASTPNTKQVAQFLRDNPDFFLHHGELLADLQVPHEKGTAVSLIERQVNVLRERNVELRERLNGMLSIARDNDLIFGKTRKLVLELIASTHLASLAQALSRSLLEDFNMTTLSLTLFEKPAGQLPTHVQVVAMADAEANISGLLKGQKIICGVLRPEELRYIFGNNIDAVGSAAIVPLIFQGSLGLLAIGARDPQHFRSGMDTLFIGHIGEVLARQLAAIQPSHTPAKHLRADG